MMHYDRMQQGWEGGRVVGVSHFDRPEERTDQPEKPEEIEQRTARAALASVLSFATDSRNAASAGRKVLVLAWLLGELPRAKSQRELAALLGCSSAAVSKLTSSVRGYLRECTKRQS